MRRMITRSPYREIRGHDDKFTLIRSLPKRLLNFGAIEQGLAQISGLRDFVRSYDKINFQIPYSISLTIKVKPLLFDRFREIWYWEHFLFLLWHINTRIKMATVAQPTFSWIKCLVFYWLYDSNLVPERPIVIKLTLVHAKDWPWKGNKPLTGSILI